MKKLLLTIGLLMMSGVCLALSGAGPQGNYPHSPRVGSSSIFDINNFADQFNKSTEVPPSDMSTSGQEKINKVTGSNQMPS